MKARKRSTEAKAAQKTGTRRRKEERRKAARERRSIEERWRERRVGMVVPRHDGDSPPS